MKDVRQKLIRFSRLSTVVIALAGGSTVIAQDDTAEESISGSNYLYIEEFELSPGAIPNEAIAEAQGWVRTYRETGEYNTLNWQLADQDTRYAQFDHV